jgi:hypothetical protein
VRGLFAVCGARGGPALLAYSAGRMTSDRHLRER